MPTKLQVPRIRDLPKVLSNNIHPDQNVCPKQHKDRTRHAKLHHFRTIFRFIKQRVFWAT
jgi:hypothetical protein